MSNVLVVHVPEDSLGNLTFGLRQGRWAFTHASAGVDAVATDDLVLFGGGVSGGPRVSSARWERSALGFSYLARILGPAYVSRVPFWPDERGRVRYNPSIDIELLGALGGLSLRPGAELAARLVAALRDSGIQQSKGILVRGSAAAGSPALRQRRLPRTLASIPAGRTPSRGRRRRSSAGAPIVRAAPIERQWQTIAVRALRDDPITIVRREQRLVHAYRTHLEGMGHGVCRFSVEVDYSKLWCDLYDERRRTLFEAKGTCERAAIRMAIGQLIDYGRFIRPAPKRRAILLPSKPTDDLLELIAAASAHAVWKVAGGFADSAGGALS